MCSEEDETGDQAKQLKVHEATASEMEHNNSLRISLSNCFTRLHKIKETTKEKLKSK